MVLHLVKKKNPYIFFVFRDAAPRERKEGGDFEFFSPRPTSTLLSCEQGREGEEKERRKKKRKEKRSRGEGLPLSCESGFGFGPSFLRPISLTRCCSRAKGCKKHETPSLLSLSLSLSLSPCGEGGGMKRNLLLLVSPSCTMAPPSLLPPFSSAVTEQKSFSSSSSSSSSWSSIPSPPSVFLFGIGKVKQLQKGRGRRREGKRPFRLLR